MEYKSIANVWAFHQWHNLHQEDGVVSIKDVRCHGYILLYLMQNVIRAFDHARVFCAAWLRLEEYLIYIKEIHSCIYCRDMVNCLGKKADKKEEK